MRILQVTNFVSHLQLPVARSIASIVGEKNFRFAAMSKIDPSRVSLGWSDVDNDPWILKTYNNTQDMSKFNDWWDQADAIICGERLFEKMMSRVLNKKICFYMSERWWKPPIGVARILHPKFFKMILQFRQLAKNPKFHYLPKGPYASKDIDYLCNLKERKWKWGYFRDNLKFTKKLNNPKPMSKVLWVGRMLSWKRVDTLIYALENLDKQGLNVFLTLVGDGPCRKKLEYLAKRILKPSSYIFIDPIDVQKVSKLMSENDIYVLPSSAYEGWGAVINEAMSSGCAIVASKTAGAAGAMIKNNFNGLLFESGNWRELSLKLQLLIDDKNFGYKLIKEAKHTIENDWSANCAADRFISVANSLLGDKLPPIYKNGPMSKA